MKRRRVVILPFTRSDFKVLHSTIFSLGLMTAQKKKNAQFFIGEFQVFVVSTTQMINGKCDLFGTNTFTING